MKLGLDFHGVIDAEPKLFSVMTQKLMKMGHEVHIITGMELTDRFYAKLKAFHISYTTVFSISSYHKGIGTKVWYDEKDTPWLDQETWVVSKAWYCKKNKIDLHLDDSEAYLQHFLTPSLLVTPEVLSFLKLIVEV